jgi:hypothetical protein
MTETLSNRSRVLFRVYLLHHYWLDDGATVFDLMPNAPLRDYRLLTYDRRIFVDVAPTPATAAVLAGLGATYKDMGLGFMVGVPEGTVVPADVVLQFVLTVRDAGFYNYTSLTMRSQQIYEIFYPPEKTIYRFKENVPVLSNQTGTSRQLATGKALFLSQEFPALKADDQVEAMVLSGGSLFQLTGDQPGAGQQQLAATATDLPVFVNQADVPAITPPPGMSGAPPRGIRLGVDLPDSVSMVVELAAFRGGDFSFLDNIGQPLATPPAFQVRFKNRSTLWKYYDKNTGGFQSAETVPLPLTHFGNAGTRTKPSEGFVKAMKTGTQITQLVSEVFV